MNYTPSLFFFLNLFAICSCYWFFVGAQLFLNANCVCVLMLTSCHPGDDRAGRPVWSGTECSTFSPAQIPAPVWQAQHQTQVWHCSVWHAGELKGAFQRTSCYWTSVREKSFCRVNRNLYNSGSQRIWITEGAACYPSDQNRCVSFDVTNAFLVFLSSALLWFYVFHCHQYYLLL